MKKLLAVLLSIVIALSVSGCITVNLGAEQKDYDSTKDAQVSPSVDGQFEVVADDAVLYDDFEKSYTDYIDQVDEMLEISDITAVKKSRAIVTTDTITGENYMMIVIVDKNNKIVNASIYCTPGSGDIIVHALLSYYIVSSLGYDDIDADAFYDEYHPLKSDEYFEITDKIGSWSVTSVYDDSGMNFEVVTEFELR